MFSIHALDSVSIEVNVTVRSAGSSSPRCVKRSVKRDAFGSHALVKVVAKVNVFHTTLGLTGFRGSDVCSPLPPCRLPPIESDALPSACLRRVLRALVLKATESDGMQAARPLHVSMFWSKVSSRNKLSRYSSASRSPCSVDVSAEPDALHAAWQCDVLDAFT